MRVPLRPSVCGRFGARTKVTYGPCRFAMRWDSRVCRRDSSAWDTRARAARTRGRTAGCFLLACLRFRLAVRLRWATPSPRLFARFARLLLAMTIGVGESRWGWNRCRL